MAQLGEPIEICMTCRRPVEGVDCCECNFKDHRDQHRIDQLSRRRWEKVNGAGDLKPIEAVRRLLADAEDGEEITHVVVVYATAPKPGEKYDGHGFYQAGPYPTSHALGLLEYAKGCLLHYLMTENERD